MMIFSYSVQISFLFMIIMIAVSVEPATEPPVGKLTSYLIINVMLNCLLFVGTHTHLIHN